ncbi:hypothetical protein IP88_09110 [alpha proteobacterium AAP81b]|nr:hypothetical protein IP88_09110 [alpha proteobacterium AAP81b]
MINILIGIGGTGAKVVESALYLLAAGAGDVGQVLVGLVDQDNGNGNLARTNELVEKLRTLRADWEPPRNNALDWDARPEDGGTPFLRTRIEPLFSRTAHWRPADADQGNLAQILGRTEMSDGEKALFDLLFRGEAASPAHEEQTMDLAEGYRGRAHVGSAALLASLLIDNTALIDRLSELLKQTTQGTEVRIFLAGSIFGGTGAAGFPTIARKIDNLRKATVGAGESRSVDGARVKLGGVMMLPYFGFKDGEAGSNVVRAGDLLPQSRIALNFYHRLFDREALFDRFYLAGWNELIQLNYHSAGSGNQHNPAMIPELVGALAAIDFFGGAARAAETAPLASARKEAGFVDWADLPAGEALKIDVENRLGQLLRTAIWWRYRMEPAFDRRHKSLFGKEELRVGDIKQPWLRELARDTVWDQPTQDAREHLRGFFKGLLEWAAAMQLFINPEAGDPFRLWSLAPVLDRCDRSQPTDPVALKEPPLAARDLDDEVLAKAAFEDVLRGRDTARPTRTAGDLFAELHASRKTIGKTRGMGRVLAALHHAARV